MELLDPKAYRIVWIAPLEIEAQAALLLLDKRHHGRFPVDDDDDYTYEAGEICGHNVVVATLPVGELYGTGSASAIASHVRRFFRNLWLGLLVGVAAGLPNFERDPPLDIRLGDVLVALPQGDNAGLIAYDLGKETENGFEPLRRGHALAQTHRLIRSAIGSIKLDAPNDVDLFLPYYDKIRHKLHDTGSFDDPGQQHDILYHANGEEKISREPRPVSRRTRVWYGPIGSGEKLMKNAQRRNELRDRYNIIGLEMEAAGTMDRIPVGVIRGVCDYGDEHKNKMWQPYAAAMAAAYAKAVLARIPPKAVVRVQGPAIENDVTNRLANNLKRTLDGNSISMIDRRAKSPRIERTDTEMSEPVPHPEVDAQEECLNQDQIRALLLSLAFNQIYSRHDTIEKAYGRTCEWLSETREYIDWFESPDKLTEHHGFLWIKGHPGAGKSTLMKSALHKARETNRGSFIAFFFNARGGELEQSTAGMYRSLLLQLLEKMPRLQIVLHALAQSVRDDKIPTWSIQSLKSLFEQAVHNLGQSPLTCFIDALDECSVVQIRDMVSFFETVGETAVSKGIPFRVCLSSRYYPHITISKGLTLDLGQQEGHDEDIIAYIDGKLRIEDYSLAQQIRAQLMAKASGIFIWIVLVVGILQQEYDDGYAHTLTRRLKDIPGDLNELFRDILARDSRHNNELLLCIRWVLFASVPLRKEELYVAILVDSDPIAASNWDPRRTKDASVHRFILSSSKGLVDNKISQTNRTVQFIHESVREFFLKDGLRRIWPGLKGDIRGESHEQMKQTCMKYMSIAMQSPEFQSARPEQNVHKWWRRLCDSRREVRESIQAKFPFLNYAYRAVLYHANEAAAFGVDQSSFIDSFDLASWLEIEAAFRYDSDVVQWPTRSLLYVLAENNLARLIECHPRKMSGFEIEEGDQPYGVPILAAVATSSRQALYSLLKSQANTWPSISLLHTLCEQYDQSDSKRSGAGTLFKYRRDQPIFANILAAGDGLVIDFAVACPNINHDINWKGEEGTHALRYAAGYGYNSLVRLLLEKGTPQDAPNERGSTPLHYSVKGGQEATARLLLDNGANLEAQNYFHQTPLHFAADEGNLAMVKLFLDRGANPSVADVSGHTPLYFAVGKGNAAVVQLLLDKGADIEAKIRIDDISPLYHAVATDNAAMAQLLVARGADVNTVTAAGWSGLHFAASEDNEIIARLLLDNGADIEAVDTDNRTPLQVAQRKKKKAVARLLLARGAKRRSRKNEKSSMGP
ncbi:hypothetical protein NLG97_g2517 [Lecanicillium saksenae]|uniref:Uncharacterized protein n=1 Tax=Lecanicillium saksenae TaxID=468837 RepID=A0ACC1R3D4_9HYPO|nr:hypothetical protein NLG97_g2517 [Lecanicillium saksenae]